MRVLVTGGTGFVGRVLVPALVERGHSVRLLVRRPLDSSEVARGLDVVVHDLGEPLKLDAHRAGVDAIVHLAQGAAALLAEVPRFFSVNTQSTVALLDFGRRAGIRTFVFASSGSVYRSGDGPYSEEWPLAASDLYAASKIGAEAACAAFSGDFDVWVFRLFQPYGAGQRDRLIPRLADRLLRREPILLNSQGRPMVSPVHVTDVVRCVVAALDAPGTGGIINVAGDDVVSIRELAHMAASVLGVVPRFEETDKVVGDLAGQNRRMRAVLGISPLTRLPEGLVSALAPLTNRRVPQGPAERSG